MKRYLILIACLLAAAGASAQKYPERSLVRKGNRAFERGRYERSIERYTHALEATPGTWEAMYNLGNALVAAERYDKSEEMLRAAAADTLRSGDDRAEAYFNLGNVQLSQQKLQEALESYKNSLRMNPADEEAKYNYAYVKSLLKNQDDNNGGGGGNDDKQNQDQNQDQNQNQNQNQNDQQQGQNGGDNSNDDRQQEGNPDRQQSDGDGDSGEQKEAPAEPRISEQEQERMLEAIQAEEDKTQDKLKDKVRGVVVKGRKNW